MGQGEQFVPSLPSRGGGDRGPPGLQVCRHEGRCWLGLGRWIDLDDRSRWAYEYEEGGRVLVGDRVGDFFSEVDRRLCGVG